MNPRGEVKGQSGIISFLLFFAIHLSRHFHGLIGYEKRHRHFYFPIDKKRCQIKRRQFDRLFPQLVEETINIKLLRLFFFLFLTFPERAFEHWHVTDTAGSLLPDKVIHISTGRQETVLCCI